MSELTSRLSTALADRYRIERKLGEGGMATVYLAEDLRHDRKVALKVLKPELAAVLGAERFVQEIKTTASLQHPNILPLFDSGEADAFLYYVMPYVEGETLREKLNREKQLGIDEAVTITTEVADALDYAHRHNVIHRDIKPENILLHDGRPMVADFGIALAVSAAAGGRMTETGLSLGTPHYMSPEQATAERDLTNRSDIYSLAAVLYETLTGDPPHTGSTAQQIIAKIVSAEFRPVRELRRTVPPHVDSAVAVALQKLPADRFESAAAFAGALTDESFSSRYALAGGKASGVGLEVPSRWRTVVAFVVVGIAAAAVGWSARPSETAPQRPIQFTIASDSVHQIEVGSAVISPDGSTVVYGARTATGPMLFRRRLSELQARPIEGSEGAMFPFFSPDGARVAFSVPLGAENCVRNCELRWVDVAGGTPHKVTETGGAIGGATWTDGGEIVFPSWNPTRMRRVNAEGGPAETDPRFDASLDSLPMEYLQMIPETQAVLFAAFRDGEYHMGVASLESGEVRTLGIGAKPQYVSTGHIVYANEDGSIFLRSFDVETLEVIGEPRALEGRVALQFGWPAISVSHSGVMVTQPAGSEHSILVMMDRAGNELILLRDRAFWVPRFSPDGARIAFGEQYGWLKDDVWIHDLEAGTTERMTFDGASNSDPVWSPDESRLAFSRDQAAKDAFVLDVDNGTPELLFPLDGLQWTTDWSRDGRHLVFTTWDESSEDIWFAPMDGSGEPRPFLATPAREGGARISPNGKWLAYHSSESGPLEVYVQTFPEPGSKRPISVGGGKDPIWGPDGTELFYWNLSGQLMAAQLSVDDMTVVGRLELFELADYRQWLNAQYDVHPDGRRFVVVRKPATDLVVSIDLIDARR